MNEHLNTKNPRGKKLNRIMKRIARFIAEDTWVEVGNTCVEVEEARKILDSTILSIEKAQDLLIAADEKRSAGITRAVQS